MSEGSSKGAVILGWWSRNIGDREAGVARGLAARLRRAQGVEVLAERAVHDLAQALEVKDAGRLIRLVQVLAEVREHTDVPLAKTLGHVDGMSQLRFQRLIRTPAEELGTAVRRALPLANRRANVAALGPDVLFWNDDVRTRWCFQYFEAARGGAGEES